MTARRPSASSCCTACAERNPNPKPAATACLMVSLLAISISMRGTTPDSANACSIARRVADPGSRVMSGSRATASSGTRALAGERMRRGGHDHVRVRARTAARRTRARVGGWLITARSTAWSARRSRSSSRLPTVRRTRMPRMLRRGKRREPRQEIVARVDHRDVEQSLLEEPRAPRSPPRRRGCGARMSRVRGEHLLARLGEPQPPPGALEERRRPRGPRAGGSGSRPRAA